ncbi:MAG: hypothetical protein LBK97_03495 [Prevotellaceae bacterium]|jgi:hypothetical protein|nr:hypothetical protein [Prevotellaceae bacterium]
MKKFIIIILLFGTTATGIAQNEPTAEQVRQDRVRDVWKSGDIRFTRSKDNKRVYAFVETFPDREVIIPSVTLGKKSKMRLLGYGKLLKWSPISDGGVKIEIPDVLQTPENRPCEYAWSFEFETE